MNNLKNEEQRILNYVENNILRLNYEALIELEVLIENELLSRQEI